METKKSPKPAGFHLLGGGRAPEPASVQIVHENELRPQNIENFDLLRTKKQTSEHSVGRNLNKNHRLRHGAKDSFSRAPLQAWPLPLARARAKPTPVSCAIQAF